MVYLKRAVRRRFGSTVTVRLVSPESTEARQHRWGQGTALPVIMIDGEVVCTGRLSLKEVVQELQKRRSRL
ncbi:MAG TPA: hypothetical protein GX014_02620 [Firmicutes bacterium]|nr:hypothetical protein [Bacillota bacterium]